MQITVKQQQMLNRVCELARELLEARPPDAPQRDDATLVEYAFEDALIKMQDELILSDPNKLLERSQREDNATKACDAHEEEAEKRGAKFNNFGWSTGDFETDRFTIMSKTSRGKFWTSRHAKTGEVNHGWHD